MLSCPFIFFRLRMLSMVLIPTLTIFFSNEIILADSDSHQVKWIKLDSDLEIAEVPLKKGLLFGLNLVFVKSSLKNFSAHIYTANSAKGLRAQTLCESNDSIVCINTNFFDKQSKPLGLVLKDGKLFSRKQKTASLLNGQFFYGPRGFGIGSRDNPLPAGTNNAVQAGPLLIENGKLLTIQGNSHSESNRAGACIDRKGKLLLFSTTSSLGGVSLPDLQSILAGKGIDCFNALNFDGGGSSQLFVNINHLKKSLPGLNLSEVKKITTNIPGRDAVPVMLSLKAR